MCSYIRSYQAKHSCLRYNLYIRKCLIAESDEKSGEKLSTAAVIFITIAITFVVTALTVYILTSMYYKHSMINMIKKSKAELKKIADQKKSPYANIVTMDPTCITTIKMEDNPAYKTHSDITIKKDTE